MQDYLWARSVIMTDAALILLEGGVALMDARQVIIRPIISEKSYQMIEQNKYTFEVHPKATKTHVRFGGGGDLQGARHRCQHHEREAQAQDAGLPSVASPSTGRKR